MTKNVMNPQAAIDDLHALPRDALILRFRDLYRSEPPKQISRDLLLRALCFGLQQKVYGGHNALLQRRLRSLAEELQRTGSIAVNCTSSLSGTAKPGTRLIRERACGWVVIRADSGLSFDDIAERCVSADASPADLKGEAGNV